MRHRPGSLHNALFLASEVQRQSLRVHHAPCCQHDRAFCLAHGVPERPDVLGGSPDILGISPLLIRTLYILGLGTSDKRGGNVMSRQHLRRHEVIIPGHDVHDLSEFLSLVDIETFDGRPVPAPIMDARATASLTQRPRRTGRGCSCHCARGGRTQYIRRALVRLPRSRSGPSGCSNLVTPEAES